MKTINNNVINIAKYRPLAQSQVVDIDEHFPLIYTYHNPDGEPLILFRFVSAEEKERLPKAKVISFPPHGKRKTGG